MLHWGGMHEESWAGVVTVGLVRDRSTDGALHGLESIESS